MTQATAQIAAQAFLDDYTDPEIEKRLFYEVWADRYRIGDSKRQQVWQEVRRLSYRIAANKQKATCRRKAGLRTTLNTLTHAVG